LIQEREMRTSLFGGGWENNIITDLPPLSTGYMLCRFTARSWLSSS